MTAAIASSVAFAIHLFGGSSLVATEVIRSGDIVTPANVSTDSGSPISDTDPLIGREVRRTVYEGQEVAMADTRPARLVKRNQLVTVKFVSGALEIATTGRAMGEAAAEESVSILNLSSKKIVTGIVQEDGWVLVQ